MCCKKEFSALKRLQQRFSCTVTRVKRSPIIPHCNSAAACARSSFTYIILRKNGETARRCMHSSVQTRDDPCQQLRLANF